MEIVKRLEEMLVEIDDAMEYAELTDTAFTRKYAQLRRVKIGLQIALLFARRLEGGALHHV